MKNIKLFENWLKEGKGIHPAVYSHLEKYFKKAGKKASYDDAKKHIEGEMKNWKLSKEDFQEAKKIFA
jgi:hypothetical protein